MARPKNAIQQLCLINVNQNEAYPQAVAYLKADNRLSSAYQYRSSKHLNKRIDLAPEKLPVEITAKIMRGVELDVATENAGVSINDLTGNAVQVEKVIS